MMLSMAVQLQPNINFCLNTSNFPAQNATSKPFQVLFPVKQRTTASYSLSPSSSTSSCIAHSHYFSGFKFRRQNFRNLEVSAPAAATEAVEAASESPVVDDSDSVSSPVKEKLGVVVKPMEKSRLVLKFIWMEKNIGIALDQMIPGHGTIPLSPYYFWPRKDAWEELKVLLESKPWISQKQMIILLNQATDIINLWQQGGGNLG
ncbi:30S ribosomal protein 3, chloroplastic-like [Momordica charantia]|uniref:30S ribosomal protein 3, chloroplastic-like n=1 Tax=Momordica charantia TaxID=3673 RepID=A0A6J1D356_MOMCH|nr:30S ribosomal protein 3, chloroplastic-like [Momordica charantia]